MRIVAWSAVVATVLLGLAGCSSGGGGEGSGGTNGHGNGDGSSASGEGGIADAAGVDSGPFSSFQQRNLDAINMYRATRGVAPIKLDLTLSAFALAGSREESMDHVAHKHFETALSDNTIWSDGFSTSAGENQGDPNGWLPLSMDPTKNEIDQIDAIQKVMFDEGPGDGEAHGHYENIMNPGYDRVGVGLLEVQNKLYLTNDFSAN